MIASVSVFLPSRLVWPFAVRTPDEDDLLFAAFGAAALTVFFRVGVAGFFETDFAFTAGFLAAGFFEIFFELDFLVERAIKSEK